MHPDGNSSGTEGSIQKDLVCRYMLKKKKMQREVHKHRKKIQMDTEGFTPEWWWQIIVFNKILMCGVLVLI